MFISCINKCFGNNIYDAEMVNNVTERTKLIEKDHNVVLKITDGPISKIPLPSNKNNLEIFIKNINKEINTNFNQEFYKIKILNINDLPIRNDTYIKYIFHIVPISKDINKFIYIPDIFIKNKFKMSIYKFQKNSMIIDDYVTYINIRKITNNSNISLENWRYLEKIFINLGFTTEIVFE